MGDRKAVGQERDRIRRRFLEKNKQVSKMNWEGSKSRGHLSPHFGWETLSEGIRVAVRPERDRYISQCCHRFKTNKQTQKSMQSLQKWSFTKEFLVDLCL